MIPATVVIPWRDRGTDPLRAANLARIVEQWDWYDIPVFVTGDGHHDDAPFNRSAAYNRGIARAETEVFVLAESDMLVAFSQIEQAVELAAAAPGLVMPFTEYHALGEEDSDWVRTHERDPSEIVAGRAGNHRTAQVHGGAINVISRHTYDLVGGFDEAFEGNGYDDDAMKRAFEICCGPTRFVDGPAYHLYHLPGWQGRHLKAADRAATARNKARYHRYVRASTPEQIRALTR